MLTRPTAARRNPLRIRSHQIAGLDPQLAQINEMLTSYDPIQRAIKFPAGYPEEEGGIIIHGPSGTGKTLILKELENLEWRKVLHLMDLNRFSRSGQADEVRKIFGEACRNQPSVIVIGRLESVAGQDPTSPGACRFSTT